MFTRHGIPQQLMSDNGSQFTSQEFCDFMKGNGIKHTLVAPDHPRSNGQAERFVQTFKQFFKAEGSDSINQSLARFCSAIEQRQIAQQVKRLLSCF